MNDWAKIAANDTTGTGFSVLVSIGMPVHNCSSTVAEAITSILTQSLSRWELIIIDDGSTDNTVEIVRSLKDPRIRLFVSEDNKGLAARLNESVALSRGEYFARMDGDDISYPERLQVQTCFLAKHPEIDLLGGSILIFDGSNKAIGCRKGLITHRAICGTPWRGFSLPHVTWMGRTEWFRANPYDPAAYYCQDRELLMRTHRASKFASLSDILVAVREVSLSTRKLLRSRRINVRFAVTQGIKRKSASLLFLAAPAEIVKAGIDWIAVRSGLGYKLLRHRVPAVRPELVTQWHQVRDEVNRTADWFSRTRSAAQLKMGMQESRKAGSASDDNPVVSIGMSIFNCAGTIAQAIKSIINQTFENWELIIIDDGSSDGTAEIARGFSDPRIRVISDGINRGLGARLNETVMLSRGRYFARMDGDDIAYPERLSRQVDFLERRSEVDLLAGSAVVFRSDGSIVGVRRSPASHSQICARPWLSIPMIHPTWMGRTEWFRAHLYRADALRMEDYELLVRTYRTSNFAALPDVLLGYREDRLSLSQILYARRNICKTLWARIKRAEDPAMSILGVVAQAPKAALDAVAIVTHLDYRLLRTRAREISASEAGQWTILWNSIAAAKLL